MLDFAVKLAEFAIQAAIILVCLLVFIAFVASLISKSKQSTHLKSQNINKKYQNIRRSLEKTLLDKKDLKKRMKEEKKAEKNQKPRPKVFLLNFEGDIKASAVEQLREEISAILMVAQKDDQVLLKLESPGGMVHGYGLAASQLQRLKSNNIHLTVCVDKIAASGGYMMACLADNIIAAPFAIIGSIGVVASLPNFNKVLKKNDVDYLEITAGEYKRTLTPLGEITETGMKKFKEQIEQVHVLFKQHVSKERPQLEMEKVATGEYWYGQQAKDLHLVDQLGTSDDSLLELSKSHEIIEITYQGKKSFIQKLNDSMDSKIETFFEKSANFIWKKRFL